MMHSNITSACFPDSLSSVMLCGLTHHYSLPIQVPKNSPRHEAEASKAISWHMDPLFLRISKSCLRGPKNSLIGNVT
jgi:hypothetical protein